MDLTTERICLLVEGEGLTCQEVGNLLGLSKTSANGKLNGNIGWTIKDIRRLACHFGVSTDYLFGISEQERSEDKRGAPVPVHV